MTRAIILGAGVMGTSFGLPLSDRGMEVNLVGTHLDRDPVAAMQQNRVHPRLRAEIGERIRVFDDRDIVRAFANVPDLIVVGISTPGVDWAVETLAEHMKGTPPLVMLTKGIAEGPDGIEILPDFMARRFRALGRRHGPIGAVGGPCIAGELAVRRDTTAIIGFREPGQARRWASEIATPYYTLRHTGDLVGLEICAALKNFYAIGVSVSAGRAEGRPGRKRSRHAQRHGEPVQSGRQRAHGHRARLGRRSGDGRRARRSRRSARHLPSGPQFPARAASGGRNEL